MIYYAILKFAAAECCANCQETSAPRIPVTISPRQATPAQSRRLPKQHDA
jgi:hypothetical protein